MDYMVENEPSPENCRPEEEKQAIGAYNKSADAEFYSKIPNTLLTFSQIHTIISTGEMKYTHLSRLSA